MTIETDGPPQHWFEVTLLLRVPAEEPSHAVQVFLEQQLSYGLRDWRYQVRREDTGELSVYDGYGVEFPVVKPESKPNKPSADNSGDERKADTTAT